MKKILDISIKGDPLLIAILDEYCEDIACIPTEKGKAFFRSWDGKVPPKLIRQLIYAGIHFATKHPDKIIVKEAAA